MIVTTHLHTFGVLIGHAKTRKTACGKRVPESAMVQGEQEATCAQCRAVRDKEIDGTLSVLANSRVPLTAELQDFKRKLETEPRYRNAEMLRGVL